jgi:disulfide bond formation protein DsbB
MYPLVVVSLVAAGTHDRRAIRYVVPIAAIGLMLSIYHYQLQVFPAQGSICTTGVPCTAKYVNALGFVSIPFMAGCGFLTILLLQLACWRARRADARGPKDG